MITYDAYILDIDEDVEEQVLLDVQGHHITCFASICPYPINVGEKYRVGFYLFVVDEFCPSEIHGEHAPSITQIGSGFSYSLVGRLSGDILDCGIQIADEVFREQYSYLDGKMIQLKIDRIDVEFL